MKILAADIGGTNSRFGSFGVDPHGKLFLSETRWIRTQDSTSFGHLIDLLKESKFSLQPERADIAVIAVAGPVERNVYSSPPFISWDIGISNAQKDFGFSRTILINDFIAQAFACRSPIGESAEGILSGRIVIDAALAVLGAGTALGKAALVPDGAGGLVAVPSEGGHANFPFVSKRECEFQEFLVREIGEEDTTANDVVSGKGLRYIHKFLTGETLEPQEVTSKFTNDSEVLEWGARFYGRVCRNYALEILSLGGVYIAGGIASRVPDLIKHNAFETEFRSSRTMGALLKNIPVFLINNEESGLWGAALFGLQILNKG